MANEEQLAILRQGATVWNAWRQTHFLLSPDLAGVDLAGVDLAGVDLQGADLQGADLHGANFHGANFHRAYLREANLSRAYLQRVNFERAILYKAHLIGAHLTEAVLKEAVLRGADLERVHLERANLEAADLERANLSRVDLRKADLRRTNLRGTNFHRAKVGSTLFADVNLSSALGLETLTHTRPSEIGINTLYISQGNIPEIFLRGCGVPDNLIEYLPSLTSAIQSIQFHSCFISYSSHNEDFANRLYERMLREHMRVWFAPENLEGGKKLHEQLEQAIQMHERLLLVLSEHSIASDWVTTEIYNARQIEQKERRRKLFPIRLCNFETLKTWKCFDADSGRDMAREIREYFIPDFSNWKDHDAFEAAFIKLLNDLRTIK